jgi:hypothetical protein
MRIIKSTDTIPVDHPVFLIFGQPGIMKTSLAYSAKDTLLLDFDRGAHRAINRKDTLVIDSWADVAELLDSPDALEPYSTIALDTVGRCLDVMTADIIRETPKLGPGGNLSMQGWGVLKKRFQSFIATLRTLGKDVVLIAHDKEDKDGDTRVVRPDIAGGSYGEVMKVSDFVGYAYMAGKDRVLDFNPTDRWIGKNPGAWAPIKVPAAAKATTVLADLIDQGRAALGHISEASAVITQAVDVWREKLAGLTTAKDLNEQMPMIKAIQSPIIQPQAAKLLMDRGAELKLTFDAKAKKFTEAEQPKPAAAVA